MPLFSVNNQGMKKGIACLFAVVAVGIVFLGLPVQGSAGEVDFLRLHIRANSNSAADQEVKYMVKKEVVRELTPLLANVTGRQDAMIRLRGNMRVIENMANRVLQANGFEYTSRVGMRSEFFPTRVYGNISVPAGVYDALIIELGAGAGDNWWCVVYPPLCFIDNNIGGNQGVIYRSRLLDIIRRYF